MEAFVSFDNSERLERFVNRISEFYNQNEQFQDTIERNVANAGDQISKAVTGLVESSVKGVFGFVAALPNMAAILVIILLAAFFISKDWYKWIDRLSPLFPDGVRKSASTLWNNLQRALFGYVRAQLVMISITALFVIIGLLIMRVDYAITIGLLIGLVDLLPYLGTGAVIVPWIIYSFIQGDIPLGIGLSILYGIIVVTRQIVEPKVLATSIGLDALSTLIAMVVGLQLFGILGLIIGPVSLVLINALYKANVFKDIKHYIING